MTKTELSALTVAELKAMAKKKGLSLPAAARKADIVAAILAGAKAKGPAGITASRTAAGRKTAAKKAAAPKKSVAPKNSVAAKRPAEKKAAKKTTKAAPAKRAAAKAAPAVKRADGNAARKPVPQSRPIAPQSSSVVVPIHDWKQPPQAEDPLLAQERIEQAKFYTGPASETGLAGRTGLPRAYGEERIVLLARDPFVVHAYWEIGPERLARERAWFGRDSRLCIRIYDITGVSFDGRNAQGYFDQEISERTGSWYFDLGRPSHSFCADLGLRSIQGGFLPLVRSNAVTTPREDVSDVVDEEWMLVDEAFWRLYRYPAGGLSSGELQEGARRRRLHDVTSPSGGFGRAKAKRK